jgi:hypothetical protein
MFADGGTFKFTPIASPETETDIPSEPDTDHIEDQSAALFELLRFRNYRTKKGVELGEHSILWEIIRQYIGNQDDGFRELNHTNDPLYGGFKYS